jgi:hypothetical protein
MCLIPFQCLRVGAELYLANKLTENDMSGLVLLARYINAPIALKYGTSGPRIYSLSSFGRKQSFFISRDRTTIGELNECALSMLNRFRTFIT